MNKRRAITGRVLARSAAVGAVAGLLTFWSIVVLLFWLECFGIVGDEVAVGTEGSNGPSAAWMILGLTTFPGLVVVVGCSEFVRQLTHGRSDGMWLADILFGDGIKGVVVFAGSIFWPPLFASASVLLRCARDNLRHAWLTIKRDVRALVRRR